MGGKPVIFPQFCCHRFEQWLTPGVQRDVMHVMIMVNLTFKRAIKSTLYGQGTGRLTLDEVNTMAEQDIIALSQFLGVCSFVISLTFITFIINFVQYVMTS